MFEKINPEKLTTIINKDIAPAHIEEKLLYNESKGCEQAKQYMKVRLAHYDEDSQCSYIYKFI